MAGSGSGPWLTVAIQGLGGRRAGGGSCWIGRVGESQGREGQQERLRGVEWLSRSSGGSKARARRVHAEKLLKETGSLSRTAEDGPSRPAEGERGEGTGDAPR